MDVNWTRGNGDAVIVVAHKGAPVDADPSNGTNYTADAVFGNGSEIGNGNYVVYDGTGGNVTVTGLTPGTQYYFSVYEYFTADHCYASPGLTGNASTTGTAPCTYCYSYGNTSYNTSTTRVIFNTIDNASAKPADGNGNAYSDYTNITTDINQGDSYDLTVQVNTDGGYTVASMVWIDWNHDCDFDDAGEEYDLGTANNVSDGATSNSPLSITVPAGATLGETTMRVSSKYSSAATSCQTAFDGEVEDYTVNVLSSGTAPVITQQPQDVTVCAGGTATFSVTATNADNYQWQKSGSDISGATSDTYTINNVTSSDAGSYTCIVSNSTGSASSDAATLTVNPATAITQQPESVTANVGDNVTFSVTAEGSNLSYQWQFNASDIPGETSDSYTINNVQLSDAGDYTVNVSGDCGTVTSDVAVLTFASSAEELNSLGINIYPNPTDGKFYVEFNSHINTVPVSVTDLTGKVLINGVFKSSEKNMIDLTSFGKGVYFIKMTVKDKTVVSKLILNQN